MSEIESLLQRAVADGVAPGIAAGTANRNGTTWQGAAGVRGLDANAAMTTDSVFRIFSMTKAMASVAALQL